jgi:hypothetical protein
MLGIQSVHRHPWTFQRVFGWIRLPSFSNWSQKSHISQPGSRSVKIHPGSSEQTKLHRKSTTPTAKIENELTRTSNFELVHFVEQTLCRTERVTGALTLTREQHKVRWGIGKSLGTPIERPLRRGKQLALEYQIHNI